MMNKKAAMEMSVGTVVTIVLLMSVLILGLVLVRTIFKGSVENIESIDQSVKDEISKLFAEDDSRKIIIYPSSRLVKIQKGNENYQGFAISIRNTDVTGGTFTYDVFVNDPDLQTKCKISDTSIPERWIKAGKSGSINMDPGDIMVDPEFVRFLIPDNAPPCLIRYGVNVKKDGSQYGQTINVDLEIKSA